MFEKRKQTRVGVIRRTLEHNSGSSVTKRPVDHVRMSGNPAYVRHTGVHVIWLVVEYLLVSVTSVGQVARLGVH